MTDDATRIAEILAGNRDIFGLLVQKYQSVTYVLVLQRIGRAIAAEIEAEQAMVDANRELIERFEKKIQATIACVWGDDEPTPATGVPGDLPRPQTVKKRSFYVWRDGPWPGSIRRK
jgi:hypothetical protein